MKLKTKVEILVLIEIILVVVGIYCYEFKNQTINSNFKLDNEKNPNLKNSGYWDLTGSPIYINDSDSNYNWSKTASENDWCSGSGIWSDPYKIENVTIDGQNSGNCIEIRASNAYFIIKNCTLYNSGLLGEEAGIKLNNAHNGSLIGNNCSYNHCNGINNYNSNNNTLIENYACNNKWGIRVNSGDGNSIFFNNANNNEYYGITIGYGESNNISKNIANNNSEAGIVLEYCLNNEFSHNNLSKSGFHLAGISISSIISNEIYSSNLVNQKPVYFYYNQKELIPNNFTNAGQVILINCSNSQISNVNISYASNAIQILYSTNITISDNNLFHNSIGILLDKSDFNYISNNIASFNDYYGVHIGSESNNNTIISNTANNNKFNGINLYNATNNSMIANIANQNEDYGIELFQSSNSIIFGNYLLNNYGGWYFEGESTNNLFNWNALDGKVPAFIIDDLGMGDFTWLEAEENLAWVNGIGLSFDPYVIENITINGQNSSNCLTIKNSNAYFLIQNCHLYNSSKGTYPYNAGIELRNVNNSILFNNSFSNNIGRGVFLLDSYNNTISNNNVQNNFYTGITLWNSDYNSIYFNTVSENFDGIDLSTSHTNIISTNTVLNNSNEGIEILYSYSNNVYNNILSNNERYGLYLRESNNNTLFNNTISINGQEGVYLSSSNNSLIYHNFLTNSNPNARDDGFNNHWDNGTIGNYWDDYGGVDANDDGIGDTLYLLLGTAGAQDNYPIWDDGLETSWVIDPIIIDDSGGGNYTWAEAVLENWCRGSGIWIDPYVIENITINGGNQTTKSCIEIRNSNAFFIIRNCIFYNSGPWESGTYAAGIKLIYVYNGQLINNTCEYNEDNGIMLVVCNNITISENTLRYNKYVGIWLSMSNNNTIMENDASDSNNFGILIEASDNNEILDNIANNNLGHGIALNFGCKNNLISENTANNNAFYGIYLITACSNCNSSNNHVVNNIVYNNIVGIRIYGYFGNYFNNTIKENYINNNEIGIELAFCYNNSVLSNVIVDNNYGIYLQSANYTFIKNNTLLNNNYCFYELNSINNVFIDNWCKNKQGYWIFDPFIIDNHGTGDYTWDEAVSNPWCSGSGTLNDPYILEFIKINGLNTSSCLIIRNSDVYFTIRFSILYNSNAGNISAGIRLENVINGILICNNCSYNNGDGISLLYCNNITISENTVNNNAINGIFLSNSNNNSITNNIETINENGQYGIYLLSSHYNIIMNNTVNFNQIGVYLYESNNNSIISNNLLHNNKPYEEVNCDSNIFRDNQLFIDEFPFEIIILIVIIISIIITAMSLAILWKVKFYQMDKVKIQEKEEKKKLKFEQRLQEKLLFVDNLLKEERFEKALINLNNVKELAKNYELEKLFKVIDEKIERCNELETQKSIKLPIEKAIKPFKELPPKLIDRTIPPILNRSLITEPPDTKEEIVEIKEVISEPGDKIGKSLELEKDKILKDDMVLLEADTSKQKEKKLSEILTAEKAKKSIFLSYSTLDSKHFQIRKIVKELKKYKGISEVLYWEADSGQDIVEYMEKTLGKTNVFVLFCSENAAKSNSVTDEWHAAFQMRKKEKMKIIPVYEDEDLIPNLLMPLLNVKYTKDDFDGFIQKLHDEILR